MLQVLDVLCRIAWLCRVCRWEIRRVEPVILENSFTFTGTESEALKTGNRSRAMIGVGEFQLDLEGPGGALFRAADLIV